MSDSNTSATVHVEELTPDGGVVAPKPKAKTRSAKAQTPEATVVAEPAGSGAAAPAPAPSPYDDEPVPELSWYVLKIQSGREDSIRDALERRVKIQGLQRFFGPIIVPTERVTEIRNNRKRVVERKTYPGYIIIQMELNEKTWFAIRETPGVGDFVGAHGKPTKMTQAEVDKMLGPQPTAAQDETTAEKPAMPPKVDYQRGDRVKINEGPFENFEGTVEEIIPARGVVKVMLVIFSRNTPVDLEYSQVDRV